LLSAKRKLGLTVFACLGVALSLTACGGGGSSSGSSGSSAATTGESGSSPASEESSTASAEAVIKPYTGQPSPFPVTEELKEVPKGATIDYVSCSAPICPVIGQYVEEAAKTMGVNVTQVKAGSAANTVSAAYDTVVAQKPDAVIAVASEMELWNKQLKQLQEADIPVVTSGITGAEEYGIKSPQQSNVAAELGGELMANYVAAKMNPESNIAVYEITQLPFAPIVTESFVKEAEKVCPKCSVRAVPISVTEIGNTAPSTIVSDLQAHPETTLAVFSADEAQLGLPAALKAAGITVETIGYAPATYNVQYLKEGSETAVLETDVPVLAWTLLDQAAREIVGQELTGPQAEGLPVDEFLTKEDKFTSDPNKSWTGYPDYVEKFAKSWGVGG
jgi:ribose transport system substrate-binding protein